MSRKVPILLYCADEDRLSIICFSLTAHIKYRILRASCTSNVDAILRSEMPRGALVLRGDNDERAVLNRLMRVPIAVCGGESVPGCVMFTPDMESTLRALEEITSVRRGPKSGGRPYNWRFPVSGAVDAWM